MYQTLRKGEIPIMTNLLLLLFALPVATIIIASILETVLKNPIAVGALAFAIYLIVAFAVFDASFLIFVILYTILAFVSAVITRVILNLVEDDTTTCPNQDNNNTDTATSCGCGTRCMRGYYR